MIPNGSRGVPDQFKHEHRKHNPLTSKIVKPFKLGALQNDLCHRFENKKRRILRIICVIQANEPLEEPDNNDREKCKEAIMLADPLSNSRRENLHQTLHHHDL